MTLIIVRLPEGYTNAAEFSEDCGVRAWEMPSEDQIATAIKQGWNAAPRGYPADQLSPSETAAVRVLELLAEPMPEGPVGNRGQVGWMGGEGP